MRKTKLRKQPTRAENYFKVWGRVITFVTYIFMTLTFIALGYGYVAKFNSRPTSTKFDRVVAKHLDMPAVTLCTQFFDEAKMKADLGIPPHPFVKSMPSSVFTKVMDMIDGAGRDLKPSLCNIKCNQLRR